MAPRNTNRSNRPRTTVVSEIKGGGGKYDAINKGIRDLNKSLAGGITGVTGTVDATGKALRPNQRTYFTPEGAMTGSNQKISSGGKGSNTTGVTANIKNTEATDAGVVSSEQGVTTLKQYQGEEAKPIVGLSDQDKVGMTTSDIAGVNEIIAGSPGISVGEAKGVWAKGGEKIPQPVDTGVVPTATYIDPTTGATTTTTGASAGTEEEKKKMAEKGMSLSESTTTAEDLTNPDIKEAEAEYTALEKEITAYKSKLAGLIISDADLKSDIRSISKAYDARIAEMRNITDRQIQSTKTLGYRLGMQFTGGMGGVFGGIISNAEQEGLLKVADIEGQKQSKILEAKAAARENNYKIYASLMDDARALSTQKAGALAELKKAQREQDAKIAERKQQIAIDTNIATLYAGGTTTPEGLLKALNQDEQGNYKANVTAEELDASLKVLQPPDEFKGMDSDLPTFEWLKANGRISAGMTYMQYKAMLKNLDAKATSATEAQIKAGKEAQVASVVSQATQLLTGVNPKTGEKYPIPGVTVEGKEQTFVGEDGYVGAPGLRFILNRAQLNGVDRTEVLSRIAWAINPDHLNKDDLLKYGVMPEEIATITGVQAPQFGSVPITNNPYSR